MADSKKSKQMSYDTAGRAIQVGSTTQEHDAADTPVVSPVTIAAGIQKLTIPADALVLVFSCDKDMRYGSNAFLTGAAADKGYKTGFADKDIRVPVAKETAYYIEPSSYNAVIDFFFEILT